MQTSLVTRIRRACAFVSEPVLRTAKRDVHERSSFETEPEDAASINDDDDDDSGTVN